MRLPPQNMEAEQSLIASILVNDAVLDTATVKPTDFYKTEHQQIYRTFLKLKANKERVDLVTTGSCFLKDRAIISYITKLSDNAPITNNAKSLSKIIKSNRIKRDLLNTLTNIQDKIDGSNIDELLGFAQSEIMKHTASTYDNKIYHIRDLILNHINEIEQHNTVKRKNIINLGFRMLDKYLLIDGPTYTVIAGRPSMGKTAFAMSIIRNLATSHVKTGIISLEMGKNRLLDRWLAMETGINSMNFHKFKALQPKDFQAINDAAAMIHDVWDVLITDAPATTIETLERQARQLVNKGAKVLFIDQLSHIGGSSDDDFKNYTKHSNRIARLKKELDIPIFLLAQLNRKLEDRADKEPRLSDFKMTGSLEEDCDIGILLHRPYYFDKDEDEKQVIVNIAKNRDGETHKEENAIIFNRGRTLFEEDFNRLTKNY